MYWTDHSHVAIVTKIDGKNISFSQHSDTKLKDVYAKDVLYEPKKHKVEFYSYSR